MLLLDFQLRMLRLAGEMMGAAAATLTPAPSPAGGEPPLPKQATAARETVPAATDADAPAESGSPLLIFPRVASSVSKTLSEVQPAPRREAPYPFAALFPFAGFPMMGAGLPTSPFLAWTAPAGSQASLAMLWPGFFGSPLTAWTSPWANLMAWTRFMPFPVGAANHSLSPFMMPPWALPALRAWADLAAATTPTPSSSSYRSASGYAVAQVVARSLLLAAGSLITMAMAMQAGVLA